MEAYPGMGAADRPVEGPLGAERPTVETRKDRALELFAGLPRHYDRLACVLSFGQDPRWRRAMVAALQARATDRVLDVATGTGLVARALVRRYGCSVVALDQSKEMLARARVEIAAEPDLAARIEVVEGEAERLPFADSEFDALTFTYLLRYVDDPGATLREMVRVVRPGGRIASLEFGVPGAPLSRVLWFLYTRTALPLLGGLVSRDWYEVGRFLGPSISSFYSRYPLTRLAELWRDAGVEAVTTREMSLGGGVVTFGVKRDGR